LPISSSAHLVIAQHFLGGDIENDYFTFDILLHLATLFSVTAFYIKDIIPLFPALLRVLKKLLSGKLKYRECDPDERLIVLLFTASVPLLAVPLFGDKVENVGINTVALLLILNGIILFLCDLIPKGSKDIYSSKPSNAFFIGLCQLAAVFPGLSRSGSTISAGRVSRFDPNFAVKFSFLMSIPAVIGANIFKLGDVISTPVPKGDIIPYAVGMAFAAAVGILSMKLIQILSKKSSFKFFSFYCITVGVTVLFLK
jgi:undecaprenyl-diphosphatase